MRYPLLSSFEKHLVSSTPHHLSRLYLIALPDPFERSQIMGHLLSLLQSGGGETLRFQGGNLSLPDLLEALSTASLFGNGGVVLLDECDKLTKKEAEALLPLLPDGKRALPLLLGARGKTPLLEAVEKEGVVLDLLAEKPWEKEKRLSQQLVQRVQKEGKRLVPDALALLLERLGPDAPLLFQEVEKLLCYIGERGEIQSDDVRRLLTQAKGETLWHIAEGVVFELAPLGAIDASTFHTLVPALRSQLETGLTLARLIEGNVPAEEWKGHLPKLFPKALSKLSPLAARLGSRYFSQGLKSLFDLELLSRSDSTQYEALLELFRAQLVLYASR